MSKCKCTVRSIHNHISCLFVCFLNSCTHHFTWITLKFLLQVSAEMSFPHQVFMTLFEPLRSCLEGLTEWLCLQHNTFARSQLQISGQKLRTWEDVSTSFVYQALSLPCRNTSEDTVQLPSSTLPYCGCLIPFFTLSKAMSSDYPILPMGLGKVVIYAFEWIVDHANR